MPAPPATPAPSRFLLSKRQGKQTQQSASSQAAPGGTQQFHTTPRFAVASTPRRPSTQLPAFSTPLAPADRSRPPPPRVQAASDFIDSSPPSPEPLARRGDEPSDNITADSPSPSRPSREGGERSPKRRRLSFSPDLDITSSQPGFEEEYPPDQPLGEEDGSEPPSSPGEVELEAEREQEPQPDRTVSPSSASHEDEDDHHHYQAPRGVPALAESRRQPHPTFRQPPRFKPPELSEAAHHHHHQHHQQLLPDAFFSPQRRGGARYVPGGLAAELRDWLVQIKGDDDRRGDDRVGGGQDGGGGGASFCTRLVVEHVRPAPGMVLVSGRPVREDGVVAMSGDGQRVRGILAGEGRLSGLARNEVVRGSLVGITQPTWEVSLEGGDGDRWAVACDWTVL